MRFPISWMVPKEEFDAGVQPGAFFYWKCYGPDANFPSGVLAYPFECEGYQLSAEQYDVNFKYTSRK